MKFFRIITSDVVEKSKLKLPSKFVARYGAGVPGSVKLEVPTGAKWRVEVRRNGEEVIWLGKGWFEFAESLELKYGDFLVFEYDASRAVFHVVVMNLGAAEIEYPVLSVIDDHEEADCGNGSSLKSPKVEVEEDEEDDSDGDVLIVNDDAKMGRKRSNNAPARYSKVAKRSRTRSGKENVHQYRQTGAEDETEAEQAQMSRRRDISCGETILISEGQIHRVIKGVKDQVHQTSAQTLKALERATAFKHEEPAFIIALRPSYIARMPLPLSFLKAYINMHFKTVVLRMRDGTRTWTVSIHLKNAERRSYFTQGWRQFTVDNDIHAGDVCLFELIKGAENSLKIVIFRAVEKDEFSENSARPKSATEVEHLAVRAMDDQEKENGGQGSSLKGPNVVVLDDEEDDNVFQMNDEDTELSPTQNNSRKNTSRNNYENRMFKRKVLFVRETIHNNVGRKQCVVQGSRWFKTGTHQTLKAVERAKAFKQEEPAFIIALQPSYVSQKYPNERKKCQLLVPSPFIEAYFNLAVKSVVLRTQDEGTWTVSYRHWNTPHSMWYFTQGWKQFTVDNDLNAGDVCLFELIKGAENALNVVMFHAREGDEVFETSAGQISMKSTDKVESSVQECPKSTPPGKADFIDLEATVDENATKQFSTRVELDTSDYAVPSLKPASDSEIRTCSPNAAYEKEKLVDIKGKNVAKVEDDKSEPSDELLRTQICLVLKELDLHTATLGYILNLLGEHFNEDLSTRRSSILLMIKEELRSLGRQDSSGSGKT